MKKFLIITGIVIGVLLIIALMIGGWVKNSYNKMVLLDQEVKGSWAQVETVLQRRFDLIPNLVETVKGYATHENEVLTKVTEARSRVGGAGTPQERISAENELSGALSRLMVVVENYPQLKANENFVMLQDQLEGTENRIAVERGRYNETVKVFNQYIKMFPQLFIAGMFNFKEKEFFDAPEAANEAPKVNFK